MIEQKFLRGDINLNPFPHNIIDVGTGNAESNVLMTKGNAGKVQLFEYKLEPYLKEKYIIKGDIPVKKHNLDEAIADLKNIRGCEVVDIHPHGDDHDIHPVCFFNLYDDKMNKKSVESFWDWTNKYVVKPPFH